MRVAQSGADGVFDVINSSLVFWEVATLTVAAAVVVVAALVVRRLVKGNAADPARRVLDDRYARGEIGRDEYGQKRRDSRRRRGF